MPDMMMPKIRTSAGDNGSVNPVFGKIAQSANPERKGADAAEKQDDDANEGRDNKKQREGSDEIRKPSADRSDENKISAITKSSPVIKKSFGTSSNGAY